jgi:mRNA-degrading endonuclease toxin of MazEF toxin-antitoxin module
VPADPRELRRGRICLAVFPFAPSFPIRLDNGTTVASVEQWAREFRGRPAQAISEARLRPVLVLHDRTRPEHGNVLCLRINTVKPELRTDAQTWRRIERREHPFFVLLPKSVARYRLPADSLIAVGSLGSVHRSAILAPTGGELSPAEMQAVSERLARLIELDLSPRIAALARELVRRGGFVRDESADR